jgi:hypothetical protein
MARGRLDRKKIEQEYGELRQNIKEQGFNMYISMSYFYDNISKSQKCSPETVRKILNKNI